MLKSILSQSLSNGNQYLVLFIAFEPIKIRSLCCWVYLFLSKYFLYNYNKLQKYTLFKRNIIGFNICLLGNIKSNIVMFLAVINKIIGKNIIFCEVLIVNNFIHIFPPWFSGENWYISFWASYP